MLRPEIQQILDEMNATPGPPPDEETVEQARAAHEAETERLGGPGEPVAEVTDARVGDVLVRLFRPEGEGPLPVVAYLHGGGWMTGDLKTYDAPMRALANRSGAVVAGVEYRRIPEHRFPAAPASAGWQRTPASSAATARGSRWPGTARAATWRPWRRCACATSCRCAPRR